MIKTPRASATSIPPPYPSSHRHISVTGTDGLIKMNTTNKKSKLYQSVNQNDSDDMDGIFRIDDHQSLDDYGDNCDYVKKSFRSDTTKEVYGLDSANHKSDEKDDDDDKDGDDNIPLRSGSIRCYGSGNSSKRQRIHWSHVREQIVCLFRMGLPYFIESRQAKVLVVKLIFFLVLDNGVSILLSFVDRDFWNALSDKDIDKFNTALVHYILILIVIAPLGAMYNFQQKQLQLHWRAWLTTRTIQLYTTHPVFYTLEMQRSQNDVITTTPLNDHGFSNATDDEDDDVPYTTTNKVPMEATTKSASATTMDHTRGLIDNPDQRISEDVEEFANLSILLCFDFASSIIGLCSFSVILYSIYPQLLYIAFLYAFGATVITTLVFHPMIQLNVDHLKYEANLRYALVRFRENVEAIAFYKSSDMEQRNIISQLMNVVSNQYSLNILSRLYDFFSSSYALTHSILSVVILSPKYFAGKIEMGVLNQSVGAFAQVIGSLSTIVYGFDTIGPYAANIERLSRFYQAIAEADTYKQQNWTKQERMQHLLRVAPMNVVGSSKKSDKTLSIAMHQNHGGVSALDIEMSVVGNIGHGITSDDTSNTGSISRHPDGTITIQQCIDPNHALQIQNLTLKTPDMQRTLIHNLKVTIAHGQHLLIVGPSGIGKSSLLRAIAGIWSSGNGTIYRPNDSDTLFLPQRPYCTMGTLRDQLLYPSESIPTTTITSDSLDDRIMDWSFRSVENSDLLSTALESNPLNQSSTHVVPRIDISDDELIQILQRINLLDIAIRVGHGNPKVGLYTTMDWSNVLSMGEQQRLAFGRLFVHHTSKQLVILDEATSALDVDNEALMYGLLRELTMTTSATNGQNSVGKLTYVSVGHRPSLEAYHPFKLCIDESSAHVLSSI